MLVYGIIKKPAAFDVYCVFAESALACLKAFFVEPSDKVRLHGLEPVHSDCNIGCFVACRKKLLHKIHIVFFEPQSDYPRRIGIFNRKIPDFVFCSVRKLNRVFFFDICPEHSVYKALSAPAEFFGKVYAFVYRSVFRHFVHISQLIYAHSEYHQIAGFDLGRSCGNKSVYYVVKEQLVFKNSVDQLPYKRR